MRKFVKDMERARRGESITEGQKSGEGKATQAQTNTSQHQPEEKPAPRKKAPRSAPASKPKKETQPTTKNDDNATAQSTSSKQRSKRKDAPTTKAAPPPKGQAKFDCGCFGTLHKALTNCLYCGRISCEREGYGFCPFCGYLVEEVKPMGRDS